MKYVALLTGQGEGCDYTIGCNKNFVVFEAESPEHALLFCRQEWEDNGGANASPEIKEIELFQIWETFNVPVSEWAAEEKINKDNRVLKELEELERKASVLRSKLNK